MELQEAIKHIIDGNGVLFTGAGFSYDATNYINKHLDTATEISYELCDELMIQRNNNLEDVANYYINKNAKNTQKLIKKLQDFFMCKECTNEQQIIANCNWRRIYTTNYDDVLEKAGEKENKERVPRTMSDKVNDIIKEDSIIHLNGYIRNLTPEKLDNEFKLTNKSYLLNDFQQGELKGLFDNDIKNARVIVFVGTSLKYDLDIQKVIYSPDIMKEKIIFIDKKISNDADLDVIAEAKKKLFGTIYHIGVDGFAEEISKLKSTYEANTQKFIFRSFKHLNDVHYPYIKYSMKDSWNLFVYGKINDSILENHCNDDIYIFHRSVINEIINVVNNNKSTISIIHSNLGNGKTCLYKHMIEYFKKDKQVFVLNDSYEKISEEIEEIAKIEDEKIIFIENYNYYLEILGRFKPYIDNTFNFIVTCRTYINDNFFYRLSKETGISISNIFEFNLNKLDNLEMEKIINILNEIKVHPFMHNSVEENKKIIRKEYNCSLSTLLLKGVQSIEISNRIDSNYKSIEKDSKLKKVLLAVIINNVVSLDLRLSDIISLLGLENLSSEIRRREDINEFVNLNSEEVEMKSSVLAVYLITAHNLYDDLLDVMRIMILSSNNLLSDSARIVIRQLISISNITELFFKYNNQDDIELRNKIVTYFDSIKDVKYYKENTFFWLQYAMACLDAQQYIRAGNYLNTAYYYAKKLNNQFDAYQIDTQYGRYLLENGINGSTINSPFIDFKISHNKFLDSYRSRPQKYYVFKQINLYLKYIEHYKREFSKDECNKIIKMLNGFIDEINNSIKSDTRNIEMALNSIELLNNCVKVVMYANLFDESASAKL
jgi:hypothetical protein